MLAFVATFACGAFFGAALYISLAQLPATLEVGVPFAGRFFGPMYRRAARMQAPLVVVGTVTAILSWLAGSGLGWLVGGLLLLAVMPLTYIRIMPINNQLLDPGRASDAPDTEHLLRQWGRLHAVRSALSGFAFVIFLAELAFA
ncbi:MAG TPA: DUF1772 domain-containing protein [Myxococcota bacterium]|nr:DUF1772 domain-containing protein [Myxococcota bacterium]